MDVAAAPFAPGQIVTVFRSRLRDDAGTAYAEEAAALVARAAAAPGFVDAKHFGAEDGERVTVVTFADRAAHDAWRDDARHVAAKARGRRDWYDGYTIQVAECTGAAAFP